MQSERKHVGVTESRPRYRRYAVAGLLALALVSVPTVTIAAVGADRAPDLSAEKLLASLARAVDSAFQHLLPPQQSFAMDFGDAPETPPYLYPTTGPSAPAHRLGGSLHLGMQIDGEPDGLPDPDALGDDYSFSDDEDGIVFPSGLTACTLAQIDVLSTGSGKLNGWIDFNDDGDWVDNGEKVFHDSPVVAGINHLLVNVPCDAVATNQTFARFRLDSEGGLSFDTVNGYYPDGEVEDYQVAINRLGADLAVATTDTPDPVYGGDHLQYELVVANHGPLSAPDVVVTDTIPTSTTIVSATPSQGSCDLVEHGTVCGLGVIAAYYSATVLIDVIVNTGFDGIISDSAGVHSSMYDPIMTNNTDTEETLVLQQEGSADVAVTKSDAPDPVPVGGNFVYTITVSNNGPDGAAWLWVTDTPLDGFSVNSVDSPPDVACNPSVPDINCDFGYHYRDAGYTATLVVHAIANGAAGTLARNRVRGWFRYTDDPNPKNNEATEETLIVGQEPDLILRKMSSGPVFSGDVITYRIDVTNGGPTTFTGVTMTDRLPSTAGQLMRFEPENSCSGDNTRLNCSFGTVVPGQKVSATIGFSVTMPVPEGQTRTITNTAITMGVESPMEPNLLNNEDSTADNVYQTCHADVMLVLDRSNSMFGQKLQDAKDAAKLFIDLMHLPPSKVGLVSFANTASPDHQLSEDGSSVKAAVDALVAGGETYGADEAVKAAHDELVGPRHRPDNMPIIIFFSDGAFDARPAIAAASSAKADGIRIVTVGLEAGTYGRQTLMSMASPGFTYFPEHSSELIEVFRDIAGRVCKIKKADLEIAKADLVDPVSLCQPITYTIAITNHGPGTAVGVVVTDTLLTRTPGYRAVTAVTPVSPTCKATFPIVTCDFGDLDEGQRKAITITVTLDNMSPGLVTDTAKVTSGSIEDPDEHPNVVTETTTIDLNDLAITKASIPAAALAGNPVQYVVTATNNGPCDDPSVRVTDTLPVGFAYSGAVTSQGVVQYVAAQHMISATLGLVRADDSAQITVTGAVSCPTLSSIINTAHVTGTYRETLLSNNVISATTAITKVADLEIAKIDSSDPITAGMELSYTLTITNSGPCAAPGVVAVDVLPNGTKFVGASSSTGTITYTAPSTVTADLGLIGVNVTETVDITVTLPCTLTGVITNTAQVSGALHNPDPRPNSAVQATTVITNTCAPDVGDAPDSTNHYAIPMSAYLGIPAEFPTVFDLTGGAAPGPKHRDGLSDSWLGTNITGEGEADTGTDADPTNNINPLLDVADLDGGDDAVAPGLVHLADCGVASFDYDVTVAAGPRPRYVNVWLDFNRDGDWGDVALCVDQLGAWREVPEWAVRNHQLALSPGHHHLTTPPFESKSAPSQLNPMWMRITLSDSMTPIQGDGRGPEEGYAFGETEDYLLTGSSPPLPPLLGRGAGTLLRLPLRQLPILPAVRPTNATGAACRVDGSQVDALRLPRGKQVVGGLFGRLPMEILARDGIQ